MLDAGGDAVDHVGLEHRHVEYLEPLHVVVVLLRHVYSVLEADTCAVGGRELGVRDHGAGGGDHLGAHNVAVLHVALRELLHHVGGDPVPEVGAHIVTAAERVHDGLDGLPPVQRVVAAPVEAAARPGASVLVLPVVRYHYLALEAVRVGEQGLDEALHQVGVGAAPLVPLAVHLDEHHVAGVYEPRGALQIALLSRPVERLAVLSHQLHQRLDAAVGASHGVDV